MIEVEKFDDLAESNPFRGWNFGPAELTVRAIQEEAAETVLNQLIEDLKTCHFCIFPDSERAKSSLFLNFFDGLMVTVPLDEIVLEIGYVETPEAAQSLIDQFSEWKEQAEIRLVELNAK